jgi:hypothetical protein
MARIIFTHSINLQTKNTCFIIKLNSKSQITLWITTSLFVGSLSIRAWIVTAKNMYIESSFIYYLLLFIRNNSRPPPPLWISQQMLICRKLSASWFLATYRLFSRAKLKIFVTSISLFIYQLYPKITLSDIGRSVLKPSFKKVLQK